MPITPLDAITFANQNMQVAASKQNDYRNRIEQQKYAAVVATVDKNRDVAEVGDLLDEQKIDGEKEHNREQAEEQTGEKRKEIEIKGLKKGKVKVEEELVTPPRILDIKV